MRWHYIIAAICFGMISIFQWSDGRLYLALLFVAVSVYYLWGFLNPSAGRKPRRRIYPGSGEKEYSFSKPKNEEVEKFLKYNKKNARNWLFIAFVAFIFTVIGGMYYPPMSLIMGGIGIYSALRYRGCKKMIGKASLVLSDTKS